MKDPVARYREGHALRGPWHIEGKHGDGFEQAVVIPALAERDTLFTALDSLARQSPDPCARTVVIVVVNQREDHDAAITQDNADTLDRLRASTGTYPFSLALIDAASPGLRLPPKEGVGLARRVGMDAALRHLALDGANPPLLFSLDADSPVSPQYLDAVRGAIGERRKATAVLDYAHPLDGPEATAIIEYETWLRCHVLALRWAGSPYAFPTIGSAIAVTAQTYALADGMPRRQAGEDFYFLQKAAKAGPVLTVPGPLVFPSPRTSWRVPFGTGARLTTRTQPGAEPILSYAPSAYRVLRAWLEVMTQSPESGVDCDSLCTHAASIHPALTAFLEQAGFRRVWARWHEAPLPLAQALARFHTWFDGFRTLKLLHHLRDHGHPMVPLPAALDWLHAEGVLPEIPRDPEAALYALRTLPCPAAPAGISLRR